MDPTTISSVLLVNGPLGCLALVGIYWGWQKDKQLAATQKSFDEAHKAQAEAFAERIESLQTSHRAEVTELTDRFINLTTTYAAKSESLIERVSVIAEALSRARQRPSNLR